MYLTTKQHDQLRTLAMAFEIPYRSYISEVILSMFPTKSIFTSNISQAATTQLANGNTGLASQITKVQNNSQKLFDKLSFAKSSLDTRAVTGESDVPHVGELNTLILIYQQDFSQIISLFPDFTSFFSLARKYAYVRNKLSHPLCKILEDSDMIDALNFIEEISKWLDRRFFWDKSQNEIIKQITALRTGCVNIPIPMHNITDMPFPEMRIVCREKETAALKEFIYGKPGAFRKQSSYCVYGYGGLGKTALVLECVRQIIQDTIDGTTVNAYKPEFLFFFSAKDRKLTYSKTSGSLQTEVIRQTFNSFDSLKSLIFQALQIESFQGFTKNGIIIIDNLETLSSDDRERLHDFVQAGSPPCIQYILTSRKEELYDINVELSGFEDVKNRFINEYIDENDLNLVLDEQEQADLLHLSKGNTLVLVLCLSRLSHKLETIDSIRADFTKIATTTSLNQELSQLPPSGFEIISEFMFKNTFEEVEVIFSQDSTEMNQILQVFTVYDGESIDIYTVSLITNLSCHVVQNIINILCHYLILEKKGSNYSLNQFAEKYIIQRFFPDTVQFALMQEKVEKCVRLTQQELKTFQAQIERNPDRKKIFADWCVTAPGDMIAAAKIDAIYLDVRDQCHKGGKFFVQAALETAITKIATLEKTSMHPYVQYQKARILKVIDDSNILPAKHDNEILDVYKNVIWTIKTNRIYGTICSTKSYASILWIYGLRLISSDAGSATRYLEDAKKAFEDANIRDHEYINCLVDLLHAYIESYKQTNIKGYLHSARPLDRTIMDSVYKPKHFWQYHNHLKQL